VKTDVRTVMNDAIRRNKISAPQARHSEAIFSPPTEPDGPYGTDTANNLIAREADGYWWRPEQPDATVPGLWKVSETGDVTLTLNGSFEPPQIPQPMAEIPRLYGLTKQGHAITLVQCIPSHFRNSLLGYASQELKVIRAFVGAHLAADQEVFSGVKLEFSDLAAFVGRSGLRRAGPPAPEPGAVGLAQWVEVQAPTNGTVEGIGQFAIEFETEAAAALSDSRLVEALSIGVQLAEPSDLRAITERVISPLRDLITFAIDRAQDFKAVHLTAPGVVQDGGATRWIEFIREYIQPTELPSLTPQTILFRLPEFASGFESLLKAWLELHSKAGGAINIFFGCMFSPPTFQDNRFLLMAQAAEAYHRVMNPDKAINPASRANRDAAMAAAPAPIREWLDRKLKHALEPSLRARVVDLVRHGEPGIRPLTGTRSALAMQVSQARNLLTHYGASAEGPSGVDAHRLAEKLTWTLRANLLRDVGFTAPDVQLLLQRNGNFLHLCAQYPP
jgi:hypothetical protein